MKKEIGGCMLSFEQRIMLKVLETVLYQAEKMFPGWYGLSNFLDCVSDMLADAERAEERLLSEES